MMVLIVILSMTSHLYLIKIIKDGLCNLCDDLSYNLHEFSGGVCQFGVSLFEKEGDTYLKYDISSLVSPIIGNMLDCHDPSLHPRRKIIFRTTHGLKLIYGKIVKYILK